MLHSNFRQAHGTKDHALVNTEGGDPAVVYVSRAREAGAQLSEMEGMGPLQP